MEKLGTRASSTVVYRKRRASRPILEGLEERMLLYSTLGAQWSNPDRITFSLVPDGTSIGGQPSVLFQSLNAKFATATWQAQFQKAAAVWQAVAGINLVQVSDNGSPLGVSGYQQGDSRFGDIRISAIPQGSGNLAVCFLPPPINGGTDAGDIVMNSSVAWKINSSYDLLTVAIHEMGHALGMGHSAITTADMYAYYTTVKQTITADDMNGIREVYGARQYDQFNSGGQSNAIYTKAANLTSYIDTQGQVSIPNLDMTANGQAQWFTITVPAGSTGTMVVSAQATGLSMLSPVLQVYTSALSPVGTASTSTYGATASLSISGVAAGQTYLVRVYGNPAASAMGAFGLQVNLGAHSQPPIAPRVVMVPAQPDDPSGWYAAGLGDHGSDLQLGSHNGWAEVLTAVGTQPGGTTPSPRQNGIAQAAALGAFRTATAVNVNAGVQRSGLLPSGAGTTRAALNAARTAYLVALASAKEAGAGHSVLGPRARFSLFYRSGRN